VKQAHSEAPDQVAGEMPPSSTGVPEPADDAQSVRGLVARNTAYLTLSQVVTIPLAMLVSVVSARYLGADQFGIAYLVGTMCGFGFLLVSWGHEGVLPARIAQERSASGRLLGTSLVWRVVLSFFVYALLALGCHLLGYDTEVQWALGLTALGQMFVSLGAACKDTIRGFERTDIPAYTHVAERLLVVLVVVPLLMLGGRLRAFLMGQVVASAVILVVLWKWLRPAGVSRLSASWDDAKSLFRGGAPFMFFGLVMALQPSFDALYLSKLAPESVMGWYGVSRRLIGVLLLPATALIGALYPTLCRLYASDRQAFVTTTSGAVRGVSLLVVPVALCCVLYPEPAIALFDAESFGPAENNLRVLAGYLFLAYFSMPLGTAILAAGKQRAWTIVQSLCLIVSIVGDPLLVPWFQQRFGNGGMGLCAATVLSEVLVVVCALKMAPAGVLDRRLARTVAFAGVAGIAMAATAYVTQSLNPFLSCPLALIVYGVVARVTGAIEPEYIQGMRGFIERKFRAARGA